MRTVDLSEFLNFQKVEGRLFYIRRGDVEVSFLLCCTFTRWRLPQSSGRCKFNVFLARSSSVNGTKVERYEADGMCEKLRICVRSRVKIMNETDSERP